MNLMFSLNLHASRSYTKPVHYTMSHTVNASGIKHVQTHKYYWCGKLKTKFVCIQLLQQYITQCS